MLRYQMLRSLLALTAVAAAAGTAGAAEIKVLSAGAPQPGLIAATPAFRAASGHEAKVAYAIASELLRRVGEGETADVLIAPPPTIDALVKAGRVAAADQVRLGRVGAGVVVRDDAPRPDISSVDALKRALLEADAVVFNRASSGLYIETMLKKLGLYEALQPRIVRYSDGNEVMHHLMNGTGREFGFGGITDILLYRQKGLTLVGPLPEEIQNYTSYNAALVTAAAQPEAARAFLRFLASPAGTALFYEHGIR
jgi:molybdate transport system substrate-binding protein